MHGMEVSNTHFESVRPDRRRELLLFPLCDVITLTREPKLVKHCWSDTITDNIAGDAMTQAHPPDRLRYPDAADQVLAN